MTTSTTRAELASDLHALGVPVGGLLIVHSSYKALAPVAGGPATVVQALGEAVGEHGTLLAPTFSNDLIDPYTWPTPPPAVERERLMAAMPYFDPATSAPHKMGAIATAVWQAPGAVRSLHPVTSWSALGRLAHALTVNHDLDDPEGLHGPVGKVYARDGWVLLLGVEHDADTTIHLAESLLDMPHLYTLPDRYPVRGPSGERHWRALTKTTKCSDGFKQLQPVLDAVGVVKRGQVGRAECQLLRSRDIVRAVVELLARDPTALCCDDATCVHCPTSRQALHGWQPAAGFTVLP